MIVTSSVKTQVAEIITRGIELIRVKYNITLTFPKVLYTKRGAVAGAADYLNWSINLNPILLMENIEDFMITTVPHELAHLACHIIYPEAYHIFYKPCSNQITKREVHGSKWKEIMHVLGCNDSTRCHSYDLSNAKIVRRNSRTIKLTCSKCGTGVTVSPKKQLAITSNPERYWHSGCRGYPLVLACQDEAPTMNLFQHDGSEYKQLFPSKLGATKLEKCWDIFVAHQNNTLADRQHIINAFVHEADCTHAGAATYYATCKKKYIQQSLTN